MDEQASAAAMKALDLLQELANDAPSAVAAVAAAIDVSADEPEVCARLLEISNAADGRKPLAPEVVRAGATTSPAGARASVDCLTRWDDVSEPHVLAALQGLAMNSEAVSATDLARAIRQTRSALTPIDQIGALAGFGGRSLAEDTAEALKMRHPLRELFAAAHRVSDLVLVESRFRSAEAWSGSSNRVDTWAADAYITELNSSKGEARMLVVIESMLRYFPNAAATRHRQKVRLAIFDAMERLGQVRDTRLQELLEQARGQLGLETYSTRGRVARLFERIIQR
jgi:hypothetical protein